MKNSVVFGLAVVLASLAIAVGLLFTADALFHVGEAMLSIPPVPGLPPEGPDWLMAAVGLLIVFSGARFLWKLISSYRRFGLSGSAGLQNARTSAP